MHKWVLHHEPETGAEVFECARCGKDRSPDGRTAADRHGMIHGGGGEPGSPPE